MKPKLKEPEVKIIQITTDSDGDIVGLTNTGDIYYVSPVNISNTYFSEMERQWKLYIKNVKP